MVPGEETVVDRPDILIVEGLNVLQPARLPKDGKAIPFVSDFFDFSVYLDADEDDLHRWYVEPLPALRADRLPRSRCSFFRNYAELSEDEAIATADGLWTRINLPNLRENILPTRPRASLILRKGAEPPHRGGGAAAALGESGFGIGLLTGSRRRPHAHGQGGYLLRVLPCGGRTAMRQAGIQ